MNRLETIVHRQRMSRLRDLAFAAFVVLVGACSIAAVQTAAHTTVHDVARR
jgi:conjugal transfer/entry exclusion protein